MEHIKYSNLVKALLHCHSTVHSFYSDISIMSDFCEDLIQIQLFVDTYETHLNVFTDAGVNKKNLIKIRILNFDTMNGISHEEAITKHNSYINILPQDEFSTINYIELIPENIKLYVRGDDNCLIDKDCIDEQYFQMSTVKNLPPIENYYYIDSMYDHYNEYIPQGKGVIVRYNTDELFRTDEFRDFIAKKVWGLIALA